MRRYPTIVTFGLSTGLLLFTGCGTVIQSDGQDASNKFIIEAEHDFGIPEELPAAARMVTYKAGQMSVTGDVPATPDGAVTLLLSGDDLTIRINEEPPGRFHSTKRLPTRHIELTFRLADMGLDACNSDIQVGPVEATLLNGEVTLAQAALALHPLAAGVVRNGRFNICAELWADFDGSLDVEKVSFGFSNKRSGEHFVELCHVPPGDPANQHTIVVGAPAAQRHLAHGDYLGSCRAVDDTHEVDSDGDGVVDVDDECSDTPAGDEVYPNGCTVIVLTADVGPDLTVVEGETVSVTASAGVVQGDYNVSELVYLWEQVSGPDALYESNGPHLAIQTTDVEGVVVFLLTVSTQDGLAPSSDELTITVNPARVLRVVAGKWHNVAMLEHARIIPWGTNRYGQLGDGSLVDTIYDVAAGPTTTLLVFEDGSAWSMGANALSDSAVPVEIVGMPAIVDVAAQSSGGLLLDDAGTVWGFGDTRNLQCELGGEPSPTASGMLGPITIPDLPANIVGVSAGDAHGVALDADGVAWVWGSRFGCTPIPILDEVVAVAAGDTAFCLFLHVDGTVWGIGSNNFGQLGNGATTSSFDTVTQVVGLSDVVQIAAGHAHSLFVTSDGTLWTSGWNRYCQLGLEGEVSPEKPLFDTVVTQPVAPGLTNVVSVAGGYTHSLAVQDDGTLWAWGSNATGQLSTGTLSDLPSLVCTPVEIELAE